MDISFITEYISPISLVICLVVGFVIKTCTYNRTLHQFIPCIVAILGVIICCWDALAFTPAVIAAGLISGLASTGLYEALNNILHIAEGEDRDDKDDKDNYDDYDDYRDVDVTIEGTD